MFTVIYVIHWFAALVIAMQSIDRIFGCQLINTGMCFNKRLSVAVKGFAWSCIAFASFGVLAAPMFENSGLHGLLINPRPSLAEAGLFVGFAALIVRSWAMEAFRCRRLSKRRARLSSATTAPQLSGEPQT